MSSYIEELQRRIEFIENTYKQQRVPLKSNSGLVDALNQAKAYVDGASYETEPSMDDLYRSLEQIHVVYSLAETMRTCITHGLDLGVHLKQLTTGTTDYGTPKSKSNRSIFFKDFECELFIASQLVRSNIGVSFPDARNDPKGDIKVGNLYIEVKHPDSTKQLKRLMCKFNKLLETEGSYGVFVVGIEDAFNLGEKRDFLTRDEYTAWLCEKRKEIEQFGEKQIEFASELKRIAALVQTQTLFVIVEGSSRLERLGNSCIFDQRSDYDRYRSEAFPVARVFRSEPVRYTRISKQR